MKGTVIRIGTRLGELVTERFSRIQSWRLPGIIIRSNCVSAFFVGPCHSFTGLNRHYFRRELKIAYGHGLFRELLRS